MRMLRMGATTLVCTLVAAGAAAQSVPEVKLQPSPLGQAAVQVGGTWTKTEQGGQRYEGGKWIVVDYSRPVLRGRTDIFGSGDQYGKSVMDGAAVWRAGANATTILTTQVPLSVGGKTVQPGVYNLLIDLKPGAWTLILSNQERLEKFDPNEKVKLYGATNYDPKFDVARAPMQVGSLDERSIEQFTIMFSNASDRGVTLIAVWENTVATVDLPFAQ